MSREPTFDTRDSRDTSIPITPALGPAWLLLQHGGFVTAIIGTAAITYALIFASADHESPFTEAIAMLWCVINAILCIYTVYLIVGTWRENRKVRNPTYGDGGFMWLIIIVVLLLGMDVITFTGVGLRAFLELKKR